MTQITISRNSHNCPVHAAESQTGKLWISYVSNVHHPRHKSNHSSVSFSRSFCLCVICPYLSAPNDTSPRIYASFTIWKIYWEKILYHKKTGNFWGGNLVGTSPWSNGWHALPYMIPICDALRSLLEHCFTRAYREKTADMHLELSSNLVLRFWLNLYLKPTLSLRVGI